MLVFSLISWLLSKQKANGNTPEVITTIRTNNVSGQRRHFESAANVGDVGEVLKNCGRVDCRLRVDQLRDEQEHVAGLLVDVSHP